MKTILIAVICCAASAVVAYAQVGVSRPSGGYFAVAVSTDGRIAWRVNTGTGDVSACQLSVSAPASCSAWFH